MKQIKFSFNFYPRKESLEATLVLYLNNFSEKMFDKKVKVMQAVSAYWLPFAGQWAGYEEEKVRQLALSSINKLQLHIQYLREAFELPEPVRAGYAPTQLRDGLEPISNQSVRAKIVEPRSPSSSDFERRTDFSDEEESFLSSL